MIVLFTNFKVRPHVLNINNVININYLILQMSVSVLI
jgi:hypothetical protein